MTPKEKANDLVRKFYDYCNNNENRDGYAKLCALIAVDEILNLMIKEFRWDVKHNGNINYWEEVKQEIEKQELANKLKEILNNISQEQFNQEWSKIVEENKEVETDFKLLLFPVLVNLEEIEILSESNEPSRNAFKKLLNNLKIK